jgi:hypothetical protein
MKTLVETTHALSLPGVIAYLLGATFRKKIISREAAEGGRCLFTNIRYFPPYFPTIVNVGDSVKRFSPPAAAKYSFDVDIFFLILQSKIRKKMSTSKFFLARSAKKKLFTQPQTTVPGKTPGGLFLYAAPVGYIAHTGFPRHFWKKRWFGYLPIFRYIGKRVWVGLGRNFKNR